MFIYIIGYDTESALNKLKKIKRDLISKNLFRLNDFAENDIIFETENEIRFRSGITYVALTLQAQHWRRADMVLVDDKFIEENDVEEIETRFLHVVGSSMLPKESRLVYYWDEKMEEGDY